VTLHVEPGRVRLTVGRHEMEYERQRVGIFQDGRSR